MENEVRGLIAEAEKLTDLKERKLPTGTVTEGPSLQEIARAGVLAELAKAAAIVTLADAIRESNLHEMEVSFKDTLTVRGTGNARESICVSER